MHRRAAISAILATWAILAACSTSPDQGAISLEPKNAAAATAAIFAAMDADNIPAFAAVVTRNGEIVWSEAFGVRNLETGAPATRDTKFRFGSVSKVFCADLAAILAEEGAVDLDADVRTYLPQFPDKGAKITLRQLLGHLGGIRHYADKDFDPKQPGGMIDLRVYPDAGSVLAIFAADPLDAPPGEKFGYTTFGYSLAGIVLEAATGKRYADLLEEKLLRPAGLTDIAVDDMFALVPDRARPYDPIVDYEGLLAPEKYGAVVNALPLNSAYKVPGGGLVGDAEALADFGELHLKPGFFSETTYSNLFRVQKTNDGEETGVGLGWRINVSPEGRRVFHHSGSQQGGRAHLAVYPDDGLVVAIMSNMGGRPENVRGLSDQVAKAFLDRP